jgi:MFS transporter, DHA2 family, multidrug resistance protein
MSRRWPVLMALAASAIVVGFDVTVLNLALPTLAAELHATSGDLQWFVDAYTLVFAGVILPAGLLGDRYGRRRMLLGGLVLFGLASVACAACGSPAALIGARALLGFAAAFVTALSVSTLPVLFSDDERPQAIAILMGATLLAYPIGPILGGWLLSHLWWGWVFLMNVPVVAIAVIAVAWQMPESRSGQRPRLDLPGVLISSAGLAALTYGVIEAGQRSWGDGPAVAGMLGGIALLAGFFAWERRQSEPLVDFSLLRSRGFSAGTALATLSSLVLFGLLFAMPQYFRAVMGTDAMGAGLRLLPMVGGLLVGLVASTALQERLHASARSLAAAGFGAMAAGVCLGATTATGSGEAFAAAWFSLTGLGSGLALPATMNAALGAVSAERSGVGSALIMALRFVGATIGVAVLGTVLDSAYRGHLPPGAPDAARDGVAAGVATAARLGSPELLRSVRDAFVHGLDVTLLASGAIAAVGVALALGYLRSRERIGARAA